MYHGNPNPRKRVLLLIGVHSRRAALAGTLVAVLLALPVPASAQTPAICPSAGLQKDWKKAVWRVPLHIALSAPVAAASLVIPPLGKKYVRSRIRAEERDAARGSDTCMKATIDLYSQTALVRAVLRMYGIRLP
jgi:hypothetical protein